MKFFYSLTLCTTLKQNFKVKLVDLLIHKKFGQCKNIETKKDRIIFNDLKVHLDLDSWSYADLSEFDKFISTYNFPENKEFKKKDRDTVRSNFPKPQFLLRKHSENNIRIALALYPKKTLTGETLLHLKSINKFEQMEIRYFLKFTRAAMNEPKIIKKDFYEYCQSSDFYFNYDFEGNTEIFSARLRIITFRFNEHILLMYAFDKNEILEQSEIDKLAESFKSFK